MALPDELPAPEDEERQSWPLWAKLLVGAVLLVVPGTLCLGLAATLLVPMLVRNLFMADLQKAKADIVSIASSVDQYAIENNGRYPASLQELVTPDAEGRTLLGIEIVPLDPWGRPYLYEPPPPGTHDYHVRTYGADGQPGGTGPDQDVDNVMIRDGRI